MSHYCISKNFSNKINKYKDIKGIAKQIQILLNHINKYNSVTSYFFFLNPNPSFLIKIC